MPPRFHSIGHSNRGFEEFTGMLIEAGVELLVDVRAFPKSRSNPVFDIDRLPIGLAESGIAYRHLRSLGGRRPKQTGVDERLNGMWRVRSFHNFADYALSAEFSIAFDELLALGGEQPLAVMCSEAVWWRCHRRIIVDYLLARGQEVDHLMSRGHTDRALMTPGARVTSGGNVVYPAE